MSDPEAGRSRGPEAGRSRGRRVADPSRTPGRRDRGSASILMLALGLLLVAAGLFGAAVGTARLGRHEARTAADLGALAGAQRTIEGRVVACAVAERFVKANGGTLVECQIHGPDLVVTVEVPTLTLRAQASARAGPVMPMP